MKKMFIVLGTAFALIVGMFAITSKPADAETLNAESYAMAYEEVEAHFSDPEEYDIAPHITEDGIVKSYHVKDADGNVVARVDVESK